MRKGLIITGPRESGKSTLAKWMSASFGLKTVMVDGLQSDLLRAIDQQMWDSPLGALLVIDDLRDPSKVLGLLSIVTDGLTVNPKGRHSFHVPADSIKLVVVINRDLAEAADLLCESVLRRFEIINVDACGYGAFAETNRQNPEDTPSLPHEELFNRWAYEYFGRRIGIMSPFMEARQDFEYQYPGIHVSHVRFREYLERYCKSNGLVYNPIADSTGRILVSWPTGWYNRLTNTWRYSRSMRITSMILIARK